MVPSKAPGKITKKPKKAITSIPVIPEDKAVALSTPELQSTKPEGAKIPLVATKKEIPAVPPVPSKKKSKTETTSDLKAKGVLPEKTPEREPAEVEIPDHEIATRPEFLAKPPVRPVPEKPQDSLEQKIMAPVIAEKKIPAVPPEEKPALKSVEAEIPEQKVAVKPEAPAQPKVKTVLEKPQTPSEPKTVVPGGTEKKFPATLSQSMEKPEAEATTDSKAKGVASKETPRVSDAEKETAGKPAIEVQKKNPEVASLPPSTVKPEIFRVEPKGRDNVFNNSDYYFNRGIFFQQAGDWQKALVNYAKSEELDPNNPDTYNNKGVVLKEMGKFDKALDEFLRAVFLDAGYAKAYNNIGVVYYMQKNYPEAIRHYLKAIDINPTNLEAFNNLAIIYKKQKELDKARGVLNRALALNPDHPGTNYNLAVLYEENSEIKPALHFYRRFIELGAINYPSLVTQVKAHLAGMGPQ